LHQVWSLAFVFGSSWGWNLRAPKAQAWGMSSIQFTYMDEHVRKHFLFHINEFNHLNENCDV
jgi:hypothetical protein